jgi:hypothetical protein
VNANDLVGAVVIECEPDYRGEPRGLVLRLQDGRIVEVDGHPEGGLDAWEKDA